MTKEQLEIHKKLNKVLVGNNMNDCNHALAAVLTFHISQCIGPKEYRNNILSLVNKYADWFYEHREEWDHLDLSQIPFDDDTMQ